MRGTRALAVAVAAAVACAVLGACGDSDDDGATTAASSAAQATSAPAADSSAAATESSEAPAESGDAPAPSSDAPAETSEAVASTISDEPVTLVIWDLGSPEKMGEIDKDYMALHPNVTIKRQSQALDSYPALLRTAIASKKGPDIFQGYPGPWMLDYHRGLRPLDDLVTADDRANLSGWEFVSGGLSANGKPYAVPVGGYGVQMYYNKALFEQAGLDPEKPPTTWDELLAACDTLKGAGIVPLASGWKDGYYADWFMDLLAAQYQTEEEQLDYVNTRWDSDAYKKAWALLVDFREHGCMTLEDQGIPLFPDAINNFGTGKGAMFVGLAANSAGYGQFKDMPVGPNLGAMLVPLVPDSLWTEQKFDYAPTHAWGITSWSDHAEVAYDFLMFFAGPQSQEKNYAVAGTVPNHVQASVTADNPVGAQILEWYTNGPRFSGQNNYIRATVQATEDRLVPQIMTGDVSIDDAVAQIQAEQDKAPPLPAE